MRLPKILVLTIDDFVSAQLRCGACGGRQDVCNSSGVCECVPTTCAQRSLQCGPAGGGDGCGHALHCGACGHVAACNVSLRPLPLGNSTACFDNDAAASAPFTSVRDCPQLVALLQSAGLQDGCAVNLTLAGLHVGGDGE